VEQLVSINKRIAEFEKEDAVVLAVSSSSPEKNRESVALAPLGFTLLSDKNHENARRYASYDDFEDMELHSTIIIDKHGKLRWKRTGGDPFKDIGFLVRELRRVNSH
jgi:peroxiredoxin